LDVVLPNEFEGLTPSSSNQNLSLLRLKGRSPKFSIFEFFKKQ
jgi:hypothetical protein